MSTETSCKFSGWGANKIITVDVVCALYIAGVYFVVFCIFALCAGGR